MAYGDTGIWGPMYRELGDPASLGEDLREAARIARAAGGVAP